ncbi:DNA-directed RNA polymerase I subunit RPA43 [Mobula hypostoma]|uniref:DNA-directed RNA polymerase I subunit RPA43 n=1 Tax=Mobula hypostoma TaxID=723540 RepID=UPI002FC2C11D
MVSAYRNWHQFSLSFSNGRSQRYLCRSATCRGQLVPQQRHLPADPDRKPFRRLYDNVLLVRIYGTSRHGYHGMATTAVAASPSLASGASLSFTDACSLIQSPHSCLMLDTCRRHLALCPLYLNRKRSGIERQLKTELFRFSERSHQCCSLVPEDIFDDPAKTGETHTGLQGVPVAYNKIRLIGELGDIFDDQGYIHVNIEADFVIFRPNIGQKLVGTVNKIAPSHIGCLVHGCFNASIPKPHHANGVWPGFEVTVGDTLEFEVVQLDADAAGVLCIRGRLDKSVQAPYGADFEELREEDCVEQDGGKAGKKKKKKKKWKDEECEEIAKQTVSCTELDRSPTKHEMENVEEILGSKSKKRKRRTEEPNTDTEIHEGDASDCHKYSKPIKKKRKFSESESDTTNCVQELKRKKRRKHD